MTIDETCKFLKCSLSTVYALIHDGRLIRIKGTNEITDESIRALTHNAKTVHTVTEVAELLDLSVSYVRRRVKANEFDTFSIGSKCTTGMRIKDFDINNTNITKEETSPTEVTKSEEPDTIQQNNVKNVVIKRIPWNDSEIVLSVKGDQSSTKTSILKSYIKLFLEQAHIEDKLKDLDNLCK